MNEEFDFDRAVFCYYMKHGKPATATEIAEYAGVSVSKVRKIISENRYRCSDTTVNRITASFAHRSVNAYQPSLVMMREELLDIRHAVPDEDTKFA